MAKIPTANKLEFSDLKEALSSLSYDELIELGQQLTALRDERRAAEEARLRSEFEEKAAKLGINPATFFAAKPKPKSGKGVSTLPPKYKDNNGNVWSGKGRRAGWLEELVKAGKSQDDYLNAEYVAAKGGNI